MTKTMKKVTLLAVCAALLILAAFAGVKSYGKWQAKQQATRAAQEKLYLEWDKYLSLRNQIDGIQMWTFEPVEAYLETRSWDNLLRARAAVAAGRQALRLVEAPQLTIDSDTKAMLNGNTDEMTLVTQTVASAALELQTMRSVLEELEISLEDAFLYQTDFLKLNATVKYHQTELPIMERFTANATNYLYLKFSMEDRWEEMKAAYPTFAQFAEPWEKDEKRLETKADAIIDMMVPAFEEYESKLIYAESLLADTQAAIGGQTEALRSQMTFPKDAPAIIPRPNWLQTPAEIQYGYSDGGKTKTIAFGDELQGVPNRAYYFYDYVTIDEFSGYFDYLTEMGFEPKVEVNEKARCLVVVRQDDHMILIEWTPYRTNIVLADPIACLVTPLDYSLLMM